MSEKRIKTHSNFTLIIPVAPQARQSRGTCAPIVIYSTLRSGITAQIFLWGQKPWQKSDRSPACATINRQSKIFPKSSVRLTTSFPPLYMMIYMPAIPIISSAWKMPKHPPAIVPPITNTPAPRPLSPGG